MIVGVAWPRALAPAVRPVVVAGDFGDPAVWQFLLGGPAGRRQRVTATRLEGVDSMRPSPTRG